MQSFPTFDPSRTTFPMFRLMESLATKRRDVDPESRPDTLEVSGSGKGLDALSSLFDQWTK